MAEQDGSGPDPSGCATKGCETLKWTWRDYRPLRCSACPCIRFDSSLAWALVMSVARLEAQYVPQRDAVQVSADFPDRQYLRVDELVDGLAIELPAAA